MLTPPTKGFAVSINSHNCQMGAVVEWIEGCITFEDDKRLHKSEFVDTLVEEGYYREQGFASAMIDEAWNELRRRKKCMVNCCPFDIEGDRLIQLRSWKRTPAYAFCLMLSLQVLYRPHFQGLFANQYNEQGLLFEKLTAESLELYGWKAHATGWSKDESEAVTDKVRQWRLI